MLDKFHQQCVAPVEVAEPVKLMALDAILQCAMSSETNCQTSKLEEVREYIDAVSDMMVLVGKRFTNPLLMVDFIYKLTAGGKRFYQAVDISHKTTRKIIERRRSEKTNKSLDEGDSVETNQNGKKKLLDFIDILLDSKDEHGVGLTDTEIREEVDTFLFAGHDTITAAVSFLIYNLANNEEVQEKCRKEVMEVLGDKPDVEWGDLSQFEYLSMAIKESLRLHNPVLSIGRQLDKPMTFKSGLMKMAEMVLPEKTEIQVHISAMCGNPHLWENPTEFHPERFTKEEISKRSPHAFVPFSAGPRNCIGQQFAMSEIKVVAAQLLRSFRLSIDENSPKLVTVPVGIIKSKDGIFVKMTPICN